MFSVRVLGNHVYAACIVCVAAGCTIGLGDQHSPNILLHRKTAELVHIDLVLLASEQGHFLDAPELVPCHLSSNTVDGISATGTTN